MKKNGKVRKTVCMMAVLGLTASFAITGSGTGAEAATGTWKRDSKGWWYSYGKGSYATCQWVKYDGKWYYFGKDGYMVDGWKKIDGKWYYFRNGAMQNGWRKINGKWYFFASGAMKTSWLEYKGKDYYFNASGCMVTGEQKIGGETYTFASDGALIGAPKLVVPNLCVYSESEIPSVLADKGLILGTVTRKHDSKSSDGDVIGQSIKAGTKAEKRSRIDITVCDNTTDTVYRYREVIDWEYTTTNVNVAPDSDWVREKNPTTEGDVTTYYWKKPVWSGWSEWSTRKVKPTSEREVETDEQFIY